MPGAGKWLPFAELLLGCLCDACLRAGLGPASFKVAAKSRLPAWGPWAEEAGVLVWAASIRGA